jgi:hypothetical protein
METVLIIERPIEQKSVLSRVTLGEFSPIGRGFSLGIFPKITKVAQIYGLLLSAEKIHINFNKQWVGLHFGRIFQKLIWSPWLHNSLGA